MKSLKKSILATAGFVFAIGAAFAYSFSAPDNATQIWRTVAGTVQNLTSLCTTFNDMVSPECSAIYPGTQYISESEARAGGQTLGKATFVQQ